MLHVDNSNDIGLKFNFNFEILYINMNIKSGKLFSNNSAEEFNIYSINYLI